MANDIPISDREREILCLVATGASNQQIAQQLSISINTVKVHLRNIFSKIGVVSRTEATLYAINNGIVTIDRLMPGPPALEQRGEAQSSSEALIDDQVITPPISPQPAGEAQAQAEIVAAHLAEPTAEVIAQTNPISLPTEAPRASASPRPQKLLLGIVTVVAMLVIATFAAQASRQTTAPTPLPAPATLAPTVAAADPEQRWFAHPPMPNPRDDFALVAYDLERRLYVIGGTVDGRASPAVDRFDPESNAWVSLPDKPTAVSHAEAVVLRGNIYVPGGIDAAGKVRDILEVFDPREQRWRSAAPLPAVRSDYALVTWEGQLYLIGGWDGTQVRGEVYIYDPQADSWEQGLALPSPRQNAGSAILSGQIYILGGKSKGGALRESLQFNPAETDARWKIVAPLPYALIAPGAVATINTIFTFDPNEQRGFEYHQVSDAWADMEIPPPITISSKATLLETSIYIINENRNQDPGVMNEYKAVFTVYVPSYK